MNDNTLLLELADTSFPISISEHLKTRQGPIFDVHSHEHHLQLFHFTKGTAIIYVSQKPVRVKPCDILLINSGETHYGESLSDELSYTVFRVDLTLLCSYGIPACSEKYLQPMYDHLILFEPLIHNIKIESILNNLTYEFAKKQEGYEMELLGVTYRLLSELLRNHVEKSINFREAEVLTKRRKRFEKVITYIENNYNNPILLEKAASIAHMSQGYFCRLFKQTTGRTLTDYINRYRIERAVILLNQGLCNVTEAAMSVGFDDINYFCRVFKKYMKESPTQYCQNTRKYFI